MQRLSKHDQWKSISGRIAKLPVEFDPNRVGYVHMHRFCKKVLPRGRKRVLEVGCHPGRYMWYFAKYFGYEPCGIEYVESLAENTIRNLRDAGIPAKVVAEDFFSDEALTMLGECDVVTSFGFVEHFSDTKAVIQRHLQFVRPGGIVLIFIPNHSGLYGWIMKHVDPERFAMHNRMSFEDLRDGVPAESGVLLAGGYLGRLGFWNSCLYQWARTKGRAFYFIVRAPFWILERLGLLLPESKFLSPESVVAIRRV